MPRPLTISIPHRLTPDEVRARLQKGLADFRVHPAAKNITIADEWQGDQLNLRTTVMSQTVTGRVQINPTTVDVSIDLPWMFAMFAGKIRQEVEQQGTKLLE